MVVCLLATVLSGCMPWFGVLPGSGSVGTTSSGFLSGGGHLPREGDHFRFYHGGDRRYGAAALTGAIVRSSDRVAARFPGSTLLVGDLSADTGGFISGHQSHRSGRDIDLAFYIEDHTDRDAADFPLIKFDRFGLGVREKQIYHFDAARNWSLVEALLTDEEAKVQWIFVSNGLKALLMEWAIDNGRDVGIVERSASVLKQPGDAAPHDDHFHVRIYCPKKTEGAFCVDTLPIWSWIETAPSDTMTFTGEELVRLALED